MFPIIHVLCPLPPPGSHCRTQMPIFKESLKTCGERPTVAPFKKEARLSVNNNILKAPCPGCANSNPGRHRFQRNQPERLFP